MTMRQHDLEVRLASLMHELATSRKCLREAGDIIPELLAILEKHGVFKDANPDVRYAVQKACSFVGTRAPDYPGRGWNALNAGKPPRIDPRDRPAACPAPETVELLVLTT
jgi:hypothetical protein